MSKRVVLLFTLVASVAPQSDAGNPLDLLRGKRRAVRRSNPIPAHVLRSDEKMTEMFGPSVLIREPEATTETSKFVTQPD